MNKPYNAESTKHMAAAAAFFQSNKVSFLPNSLKESNKEKKVA